MRFLMILTLMLALTMGCATSDQWLLEPALDDRGVALVVNRDGEQRPVDAVPEAERADWQPIYLGPKDMPEAVAVTEGAGGAVGLVGLGGLIPLLLSVYWKFRRRDYDLEPGPVVELPKPEPEPST